MAGFPLPAPVPPLALFGGKKRIPRLGYGGPEDVLTTDVHLLAGNPAEPVVELDRILPRQLPHGVDAEQLKIPQHGRPDGDQIAETPFLNLHEKPPVDIARGRRVL
jgi:hypothetical protein